MNGLFYLVVYGFIGFILERIINMMFYGAWVDNSVLYGPIQPMYAVGVVLTIALHQYGIKKRVSHPALKLFILWVGAYLFTAMSEYVSGVGYEYLYGVRLWDYRATFPICTMPYVCFIPTGIFAMLAVFAVVVIHPHMEMITHCLPKWIKISVIVLFFIDVFVTYIEVLL